MFSTSVKSSLVAVALATLLLTSFARTATAATLQVAYSGGTCAGTGSFTADPSGGAVTDFLAAITCGLTANFVGTTSATAIFTPPNELLLQSATTVIGFESILSLLSGNLWTLQVTGFGTHSGTYEISTPPVPIPAALPLLAAGLSAMGFMGWRRRKALA